MLQRNLLPLFKLWYLSTKLHSFIAQKTIFFICQDSLQSGRNSNEILLEYQYIILLLQHSASSGGGGSSISVSINISINSN